MAAARLDEDDGITDINITPLVDVFLVLMIIVMICSSLLDHREIPVSVPQAAHADGDAPEASGLSMNAGREVFLDGNPSDSAVIVARLREKASRDPSHQVLIAADKSLPYEEVIRLLDWVRGAGVRKYALKTARQP